MTIFPSCAQPTTFVFTGGKGGTIRPQNIIIPASLSKALLKDIHEKEYGASTRLAYMAEVITETFIIQDCPGNDGDPAKQGQYTIQE